MKRRVIGLVLLIGSGCFHDGDSVGDPGATATTGEATTEEMSTTSTTSTTTTAGAPGESTGTNSGEPTSTSAAGTTEVNTGEPPAICGDGVVAGDETCDLGPANDDAGPCTSACQLAQCGDGLLHVGVEECDHGNLLNNDNAACTKGCKKAKCGDGLVFWGVEECDEGPNNQAGLYGGCTPMTCTLGPHCGDKVIQAPKEECDEGDQNGKDGKCLGSCVWNGSVVFVTSKAYTGALGGLSGADDKCNTLAMEAGVPNAGAFMAWIGVGDITPASRMKHSTGRYLLRNGTVIAESWTDLTDGWLAAPIDRDEKGAPIEMENPTFAWTGANAYGTGTDPSKRCLSWSNGAKDEVGRQGALGEIDFTWSSAGDAPCWLDGRLICVEQI